MCFADAASSGHYYSAANRQISQQSRPTTNSSPPCAAFDALFRDMRLPRLTTARTAEKGPAATTTKTDAKTTTAAATTLLPRASDSPSDPAIRRCQSARPRASAMTAASTTIPPQRARSHCEKARHVSGGGGGRTRELPIPGDGGGGGRSSPRGNDDAAEEMDLARMYDYATWNMYQRIVSARRKRLAQIDLQKMREATGEEKAGAGCTASTDRPSSSSDQDEGSTVSSAVVPPSERQGRQQQQRRPNLHAMNKNPSQDESSTLTTADETDGSSSTSSWSRADSPIVPQWCVASGGGGAGGLAPLRRLGFPSSGTMGIRVAGHPNDDGSHRESTANNEDDAFIFEMDM